MITETFDNRSKAIINPMRKPEAVKVDVCIVTFSHEIEKYVAQNYASGEIAALWSASGKTPIYLIESDNKRIAFFRTFVGAPITTALMEDSTVELDCDKYVLFGGAGCLNKEIAHGKVMVPTAAYRDEGTSYHYAPASDYIDITNGSIVADFMAENKIPYVLGKTWTTDSFYRETRNNFEKRKADGCISVEMESAGVQAMCTFRNLDLYVFFTGGDLLDAPEWDSRFEADGDKGQHDVGHFRMALELAKYVGGRNE
ncbi:MAG: nucleoside phosphorylase [Eubacterium sp.]|nr:nucleoside phosphorylase [Eubacterium sp.]